MLSIQRGIAANASGERGGDCFVQTLANAYKLRYSDALAIAERCGFTPKNGTPTHEIFKLWQFLGVPFVAHGYKGLYSRLARRMLWPDLHQRYANPPPDAINVSSWLKISANQTGRYMLLVKGHIFAVVHGNILDDFAFAQPEELLNRRVQVVARVSADSINNLHFLLKGTE